VATFAYTISIDETIPDPVPVEEAREDHPRAIRVVSQDRAIRIFEELRNG
jgi:hypothetical protein